MLAKDAIDLAASLKGIPNAAKGLRNAFKAMNEAKAAAAAGREICFVAGTQVLTDKGKKSIELIKPGDVVLSRDESSGEVAYKPVLQVFITHPQALIHLTYQLKKVSNSASSNEASASSVSSILVGTPNHPFWSLTRNKWIPMGELKEGEQLLLSNGEEGAVVALTTEVAPSGKTFTTYNFEVADWHTYFVAPQIAADLEPGVCVHNLGNFCAEGIQYMANSVSKMNAQEAERFMSGIYRHTGASSADIYKVLRTSGMNVQDAVKMREKIVRAAGLGLEVHHVLPQTQEFAAFFARRGIDIEEFTVDLSKAFHRLKSADGLHTNQGGVPGTSWNMVWKAWIATNPNATQAEVLEQASRMLKDFGVE